MGSRASQPRHNGDALGQHSHQMFDWLRALFKSIFSQSNSPIIMQNGPKFSCGAYDDRSVRLGENKTWSEPSTNLNVWRLCSSRQSKIETLQTTALLNTARIIKKVLEL